MSRKKKVRYNENRDHKKQRFLEGILSTGTLWKAAKLADVDRTTIIRWRKEDEAFNAAVLQALEECNEAMESTIYESALAGNVTCMIVWKKAHDPRYRERLEHSGTIGIDGEVKHKLELIQQADNFEQQLGERYERYSGVLEHKNGHNGNGNGKG